MCDLSIASVSLDTGIAKEVLRKWETRYGFPSPERDGQGNRLYSAEELQRLRLIKRLMDGGMRPAQIVPLPHVDLLALVQNAKPVEAACQNGIPGQLIGWLKQRDPVLLREKLQRELVDKGLDAFIVEVVASMNICVGDAWERNEIAIRDEHLYSEIIQDLLRTAIAPLANHGAMPRILITTPVGEIHALGMLMLQGFLAHRGVCCLSLGAQTPPEEIAHAAHDYRADVVAMSFSASFPLRRTVSILKDVRAVVAPDKELWAGGQGVVALEKNMRGVRIMRSFAEAEQALLNYRSR